jgi:hypothetical protein
MVKPLTSLNVVLFRAFNLSYFRDCVSEFSAGKNAKIIIKALIKSTAFANAVMEEYIKVAAIENGIEAQLLGSILTERDIPHRMRSYYDTALDGLFQAQKGWGFVSAPESFKDEIREIISDLRKYQSSIKDSPESA